MKNMYAISRRALMLLLCVCSMQTVAWGREVVNLNFDWYFYFYCCYIFNGVGNILNKNFLKLRAVSAF